MKAIQTSCNLEISCNLAFELKSLVYKANSCSVEGLALSIRLDLFLVLVSQIGLLFRHTLLGGDAGRSSCSSEQQKVSHADPGQKTEMS